MLGTFVFWNFTAEIGEVIVENRLISSISINPNQSNYTKQKTK